MAKHLTIDLLTIPIFIGNFVARNTINVLKSTVTILQLKHKKGIIKTTIKKRGKRALAATPVAGLTALSWFKKIQQQTHLKQSLTASDQGMLK